MFIWSFVAHDLLPLGEAGVRELPNEQAVLDALKTNLSEDGLYLFPGRNLDPNAPREEKTEAMKRVMQKIATGPSGLLVYHPTRANSFGQLLGIEFGTELLESILLVFLLAQTRFASFGSRVGFVFVAAILAALATNVSYWNWYGFPGVYTASCMLMQFVGFLLAGVVAALVLGRQKSEG
jgi:hypothetical protein